MKIPPFATEQFFAQYEFSTPYNLCASDCETLSVAELLAMAGLDGDGLGALRLGYTESQGDPALRTAVADTYQTVDPDHVIMLGAPEEGIYLTMRALLEPGDHVVVLTPAYDSLRNLAHHVSRNVTEWPIREGNGRWHLDLDHLEQLLTRRTRLLIVNFPHNPTGLLPTAVEFEALIELARRRGVWLFCDEMYRGLEFDPAAPQLPSAADRYERVVVLAGLSKVHGLPGLRTGWLVVSDTALRWRLVNWKHYTTICAPAPSEFLARAALAAEDQLIARSRGIVRGNLALADAFFGRWEGLFDWKRPQAGSVALVGVNVPSAGAYCRDLARDAGVLLLPGPHLGADDRHVRFGFGRTSFGANLVEYEQHLSQ